MPAALTDTSGGSNTLAISPGQRGASAGLVAILALMTESIFKSEIKLSYPPCPQIFKDLFLGRKIPHPHPLFVYVVIPLLLLEGA